jgi:flagellin
MSADAIGVNEVSGAATSTVSALGDVQTVDLANNMNTSSQTINLNGTSVTVAAGAGAAAIADTINAEGNGVVAEASLEVEIEGITQDSTSKLQVNKGGSTVDEYDLATYGGDMERLAKDMQEDGYDAVYDSASSKITFKATDVDGIDVAAGATADTSGFTFTSNGTTKAVATAAAPGLSVSAELNLSSADKIGISGTKVDEILGGSLTSTGGTSALTTVESIDISGATSTGAQDALKTIDAALAQIDAQRADLGAVQNRFGNTISNLANVEENVSAARSRIQDTDYASETAKLTKNQIMQQAGTSILAQSNQLPQAA